MALAIDELLVIMNDAKLSDGCSETREAVTRLCIAFRESQQFPRPVSYKRVGLFFNLDANTVWFHWKHLQRHGHADVENGRPSILGDGQLEQMVNFATQQFYAMQLITPARLPYFIYSQYAIDIGVGVDSPRPRLRSQRLLLYPTL
jgi:hypothetical protein